MNRRAWTSSELDILRREYPLTAAISIARALQRSERAIHIMAHRIGVKKCAAFLSAHASRVGFQAAPNGAVRLDSGGYLMRKVSNSGSSPRDWQREHVRAWESVHGPVPPGHAVCFRNGDKTDIRPDNLVLISRPALLARNSYHNWPKELAQVIKLHNALVRTIDRRVRHEK